ncbi:MAG: leucine-rich repeat domain-containing protein, partial [Bacteroidales bacterium]
LQSALVADYTVNTNRDSYISYAEAQAATTLNLSNKSISDISDLNSSFTNITSLNVTSNNLTSVPLYNCHKITTLDCSYNKITSLTQIRYMTSLSSLRCNDNYITTLDATTMVNPTSY